ncbi:hypothetical protein RRG08_058166 [Elysia crispata]|uniref:C-type lectin domain-containing protein n=1 Tax=Elysia crispata TaxID=231223 RepID=A0AAE1CR96_9GAST|nr:hypothetical protein RRG08_058166 [Elysia crispata]
MRATQCLIFCLLTICAEEAFAQGVIRVRNPRITRHNENPRVRPMQRAQPKPVKAAAATAQRQEEIQKEISVTPQDGCPEEFVRFKDSCFSYHRRPRSWRMARESCKRAARGGDLASIDSEQKIDFIRKKFGDGKNKQVWVGLHKKRPGAPYLWLNGKKARNLPAWAANQTEPDVPMWVALNLSNGQLVPKTNPMEKLPYLCGTRRNYHVSKSSAAANPNYPVKTEINKAQMDTREDASLTMTTCRQGWQSYEEKCYKAFNQKTSFKNAVATCKKTGANLLSLHSPGESEFVRQHVMTKRGPGKKYWLGISNSANGLRWSDGSPLVYSRWRNRQPVLVPQPSRKLAPELTPEGEKNKKLLERCFQLDSEDSMWDDFEDCEEESYFMCDENGDIIPLPLSTYMSSTPPGSTNYRSTLPTSTPSSGDDDNRKIGEWLNQKPEKTWWEKIKPYIIASGAAVPGLNVSGINMTLYPEDFVEEQKSASVESVSGDDNNTVPILVVLVGSVVLVVAVFGALSYRHQYGNFPNLWISLYNSIRGESHKLQNVKQSLRDQKPSEAYGAME